MNTRTVADARAEQSVRNMQWFVYSLNNMPRDHIDAMHLHARQMSQDFAVEPSERSVWADVAKLTSAQLKRFGR